MFEFQKNTRENRSVQLVGLSVVECVEGFAVVFVVVGACSVGEFVIVFVVFVVVLVFQKNTREYRSVQLVELCWLLVFVVFCWVYY